MCNFVNVNEMNFKSKSKSKERKEGHSFTHFQYTLVVRAYIVNTMILQSNKANRKERSLTHFQHSLVFSVQLTQL